MPALRAASRARAVRSVVASTEEWVIDAPSTARIRIEPSTIGGIEGRHIQDEQDVDDHHQDIGAEDRSDWAAAPAAEQGAADHHRGEHLQQHGIADERVAGARLGADEHPRQPVERARQDIDEELVSAHVESGGPGGIPIRAD